MPFASISNRQTSVDLQNSSVQLIQKYFPELSTTQVEQFARLQDVYTFWNNQINVISRKDMDNFYERHVLHSLSIAKLHKFKANETVLDIGTGGGFPGIPLAIYFPETKFILCDSIGKKIRVAQEVSQVLNLKNVQTIVSRAELLDIHADEVVTRAVAPMADLLRWTRKLKPKRIIALKGGDLKEELSVIKKHISITDIKDYFDESFFETKKIIICA